MVATNKLVKMGKDHQGVRSYYVQKIDELRVQVAQKTQNLRRLEAQRNDLNNKGTNLGFNGSSHAS